MLIDRSILSRLEEKAIREYRAAKRGLRKPSSIDVFQRHVYIPPDAVTIRGFTRRRPYAVFNPGGLLRGKRLVLYARAVVGYYWYVSVIIRFELDIDELLSSENSVYEGSVEAEIAIYPSEWFESGRGCEDPRVHEFRDELVVSYAAVAARHPEEQDRVTYQAFAVVRGNRVAEKHVLRVSVDGIEAILPEVRDSTLLGSDVLLFRPYLAGLKACWSGRLASRFTLDWSSARVTLMPEEWESKVGWSTNPVRLDSEAYLVGYHGVLKLDHSYHNGFAVVSRDGELQGLTDYLLSPRNVVENSGDRPFVIFGCTLLRYSEKLVWVGGVSDHAIGVYSADLDAILERVKWVEKR